MGIDDLPELKNPELVKKIPVIERAEVIFKDGQVKMLYVLGKSHEDIVFCTSVRVDEEKLYGTYSAHFSRRNKDSILVYRSLELKEM